MGKVLRVKHMEVGFPFCEILCYMASHTGEENFLQRTFIPAWTALAYLGIPRCPLLASTDLEYQGVPYQKKRPYNTREFPGVLYQNEKPHNKSEHQGVLYQKERS